jgi:periplasmic mercuric ion binding protein
MKTHFIVSALFLLFALPVLAQKDLKKETVKVWGNCGMCESNIEKAAKDAGALEADWNSDTKMLLVSYKAKQTDVKKIQQSIAGVGYDTQDFTGSNEAYNKLHSCCKYDRKAAANEGAAKTKMECCADPSKCEKACCKDGKCSMDHKECCTDPSKCEKACCKDGKCTMDHKECCTDPSKCEKPCCKDGKCTMEHKEHMAGKDGKGVKECCKKG